MSWSGTPIEAGTVFVTDSKVTLPSLTVNGYIPSTTLGIAWVGDYSISRWILGRTRFATTPGVLRVFTQRDFGHDDAGFGAYNTSPPKYGLKWPLVIGDIPKTTRNIEGAIGVCETGRIIEWRKFPFIMYFDSNDYTGGVYGGAPYTFEFVVDDAWSVAPYSASPTIWPTHIPKLKYAENWAYSTDGMAFDPVLKADCQEKAGDTILDTDPTGNFGVVYSQPSVVHLTGSSGGHIGWLLLLNRARSWVYSHNGDTTAPAFDAGGDPEESSGSSFWDVVGYFDPGLEPTFSTGDTIGPFLLVSGDCRCSVGVEPHLGAEGSKQDLLTWVGTCGGVEMEVDGDLWLYLYYDVDTPSALSGGVTYSDTQNKIRGAAREPYPATMGPDALDDSFLFGKYIAAGDGSICVGCGSSGGDAHAALRKALLSLAA